MNEAICNNGNNMSDLKKLQETLVQNRTTESLRNNPVKNANRAVFMLIFWQNVKTLD